MKGQENTGSESVEVSKAKGVAFDDFDFVIASFRDTVGVGAAEGVENGFTPVLISAYRVLHFWDAGSFCFLNPLIQGGSSARQIMDIADHS